MKHVSAGLVLLLMAGAARAQEGHLSATSPSWGGLEIRFVSRIEPPGTSLSGGVLVGGGQVHRVITDRDHKTVFGYDVELEPGADGSSARVRMAPFHPEDSKVSFEPGFAYLGLPKYPVIDNVKVGDTVVLDVLASAATGQKVVDYLTLARRGAEVAQAKARDFQLTDVSLTVLDPKILVDGKPEPATGTSGFTGPVVWMYVQGHGRFVVQLTPNDKLGFVRNGTVSGNTLRFHDGAAEIRIVCSSQVAPGDAVYNLYVAHEPGWRLPPGLGSVGAADKPEYILGKK